MWVARRKPTGLKVCRRCRDTLGSDLTATENAIELARLAARAANRKKGLDIVAFDVSERLAITDIFLIVGANNERLVGAIVTAIEEQLIEVSN